MKAPQTGLFLLAMLFTISHANARDRIKLETTIIKGNKEMPQIVYIVPWKNINGQTQNEQTLVLHSLFGNLFEPVHDADTRPGETGVTSNSKSLTKVK